MTRNKYILLGAFVLVIILAVAFVSQIRKLQRQLRSSVRIIPSESKSREDTIRNGVDEGLSSGRPELLVKFRAGTSEQRIGEITNRLNDRVRDEIEAVPGLTVIDDPDDADPAALAAGYQAVPEVEYAEPNYEVTLEWSNDSGVNDPRYAEQRWLVEINAPDAWAITKGSDQIVVAVLDSGVEYSHADLRNNIWTRPAGIAPYQDRDLGTIDDLHGFNAVMNDGEPLDDTGHGTSCAGIIGAECGNRLGICGVNWKTKIMPLKFVNAGGFGTVADAVKAINYAVNRKLAGVNLRVINASWGLSQPSRALEDAIARAYEMGILFIAASSNARNNETTLRYPADYKLGNVLSVTDTPSSANVSLIAPGENILTTALGNEFALRSGTSMATSIVSGVAALTLAAHPGLSVDQLRSLLLESVNEKPERPAANGKRINAAQAVKGVPPVP